MASCEKQYNNLSSRLSQWYRFIAKANSMVSSYPAAKLCRAASLPGRHKMNTADIRRGDSKADTSAGLHAEFPN